MPLADALTLDALDFAGVRDRVVGATRTQRGRREAAALAPFAEYDAVRAAQRLTAAAREMIARADLFVAAAADTAELTQAAALGRTLGSAELRSIGDALAAAAAAYRAAREDLVLREMTTAYAPLPDLQRAIVDGIDERGMVLDRASPALGRIRRSLSQAQADARERVAAVLKSAKYAKAIQEPVVTIREGRFVVPVKAEFSGMLAGIVHDTSSSGQTLFVEPLAALETNNRLRTLRIEEEREVQRILTELSARAGAHAGQIEANVEMLAALDVLVAKAEVARAMDAVTPELSDEPEIAIERGRHPLLGNRAVPQSLALGDGVQLLVISGPNMGGKTVTLKMVGLLIVMTYCGMQIPAAGGSRIGRFERVVADIGDRQSIAADTSTFSAHLQRMRELLERADARTLAIVDEIGGDTEPGAGAALATAMLEYLLAVGARGIVATHATELKLFAHADAYAENASVRFDPATFRPTFQLDVGIPGQSLAIPLARALGIEEPIVARAQELLDERERNYEAALAELAVRNAQLQQMRGDLDEQRRLARDETETVRRERIALDAQRRAFGERAEERMQQALREFVRELRSLESARDRTRERRPRVSAGQAGLLARTIEAMHRDLGIQPEEPVPGDEGSYAPDERVRIASLHQEGTVVEDYGETLLVAVGPMKTVVRKDDVHRQGPPAARAKSARMTVTHAEGRLAAAARTSAELDVRGKRYVEAEPVVERWIDEAMLAGHSPVRLIHGKGTGMLGRGLQEYLRAHPAVKSVRYGNEDEGSSGVTVVELEER